MSDPISLNEIPDPRMMVRSSDEPGIGGNFRVRTEEFLVEELSEFEPCGSGEHLYLRIMKNGVSHGKMINCLKDFFQVNELSIGYAGMKDRRAITHQTVSIHTDREPPAELNEPGLQIIWADRHSHKLRKGQLQGNRFVIRIRDVDPLDAPKVWKILQILAGNGLPNAYMSQRFGYRLNNHRLGVALVERRWKDLLDELLGTEGSDYPIHEQTVRECYMNGRYEKAIQHCSREWWAERAVLKELNNGAMPAKACAAVPGRIRQLWIDAAQASIYNSLLAMRLQDGTAHKLLPGDIPWNHQRSQWYRLDREALDEPSLVERVREIDISATGPLHGKRMPEPGEEIQRLESLAADTAKVNPALLLEEGGPRRGGRRPLRVPLRNHDLEAGTDEHGSFISISFDLPKGAYATGVLSEVMGFEAIEERGWLNDSP